MKAGDEWRLLRLSLTALWLSTTLYVSIPDYPYHYKLWYWLTMDPNGFLHEVFYIAVGFVVLLDLTYHWEQKSIRNRFMRAKMYTNGAPRLPTQK